MRHHFMNSDLIMPSFSQQMSNTRPYPLIMAPAMNFEVKVKQQIDAREVRDSTARASILGPFEEGMHHGDVKRVVIQNRSSNRTFHLTNNLDRKMEKSHQKI